MLDDILLKFKESQYYKRLFDTETNIICVFLTGSRSIGTEDIFSDYDIIVFHDGNSNAPMEEYIKYQDTIKIHWYQNNLKSFTGIENANYKNKYGNMLSKFLKKENILYINYRYEQFLNYFIKISDELSYNMGMQLYRRFNEYLKNIVDNGIQTYHYSKILYDLCCASYIVLNKTMNLDFLKEIKRIKTIPVSNSCKEEAYALLKEYYVYCSSVEYNYEQESQKLYNMLLQALPGDK